jgi:biopolymer transport protein ExbD
MPSACAKRRSRRRQRADEGEEPEFQVAPMIDVLLVLTLFFMSITSTELLKKDKNLQLADAKNAKEEKEKKHLGQVVVNVTWNHNNSTANFSIDGLAYPTADSMQGVLARQMHENPKTYVLIRADKDVQYSNISDVMTACAASGIGTVSFAVITGGSIKPKTAAPDAGGAATP